MVCVLPGFEDVLAKFLLFVSMLMRDDLPTLDRPIKAYSGLSGVGHLRQSTSLCRYSAALISITTLFSCQPFVRVNVPIVFPNLEMEFVCVGGGTLGHRANGLFRGDFVAFFHISR